MDAETIKKELDGIKTDIQKGLEKANGQAVENGKVNEDLKAEIKAAAEQLKEKSDLLAAQQKQLDEMATSVKKFGTLGNSNGTKSVANVMAEKFSAQAEDFKNCRMNKKGFVVELDEKAVGNMATATNLTGTLFVQPTQVPGIILAPYNPNHLRNYLVVGSTNSNLIRYVQDNGGEGGPTMVAEGGLKPQSDRDLEIKDAPVRKVATYFRVPEEMIDDISYLATYLGNIGVEEVKKVEDTQILYGDGTGQNLSGIATVAASFSRVGGIGTIANANSYDVLVAAKAKIRTLNYVPSAIWVNPGDYAGMKLAKDANGRYLFPEMWNGGIPNIDGVPIVENNAVAAGDYFIGDFRTGLALFDRMQANVRFYDQDQDNAIRNLITIVIEERIALPIYRPNAIIQDTFAASKTALAAV